MIKRFLIIMFLLLCVPVFAQRKLTTNEAIKLAVGPFFDSTDGITPETGITVTALTVEIYREFDADTTPTRFANFVPTTSGGGVNDMVLIGSSVSGMYSLEVTAAQLNFTGPMVLTIVDTDSAGIEGLPYWRYFNLTSANVVDAEYGSDKLQVDQVELGGSAQSTTDLKDFADAGYDPATDKVEGVKLADTTTTNSDMVGEPSTALSDVNLDHLVKSAVDTNLQTTVHDDSVLGYLFAGTNVSAYVRTEDSLEDLRDYITIRSLAAAAYFLFGSDEVTTDTASRTASKADVSNLDVAVSSRSSHDAAAVKTAIEAGGSTLAQILADTSAYDTDAEYAAAIWNALTNAYGGVGTYGQAIEDGAGGLTAQQVWEYDISAIANTNQSGGVLIWLFNLAEGDEYIDTTQTPWQWVKNKKGTPGTEYLRKNLLDVSGGNITSTSTVIGKQTEP